MSRRGSGRGGSRGRGRGQGRARPTQILYVDAYLQHTTPTAGNEFDTWIGARNYFAAHANIIAGTHRARLIYKYSTTAYGDTQVPFLTSTQGHYWSLLCLGETGGPATQVNDQYNGDFPENQTDTFVWALPGEVTSPLGLGDFTVKRNGVVLKPVRDFEFTWDSYDYTTPGYPALAGTIRLVEWSGNPGAPVSKPLGEGELLQIKSVEARPILDPATGHPCSLTGQSSNPEREVPPNLVDFYGLENFVCTSGNHHTGSVSFTCQNWRVKNCFLFGLSNGIGDAHPQAPGAPMVRGQYEVVDTTIFDCGANSELVHNAYLGRAANIILENVVSTDVALFTSGVGRSMKVKATDKLFVKDCVFGERTIADWMGWTVSDGPDCLSSVTETTTTVIEDTIFHKRAENIIFVIVTSRKTPWNEAIDSHGPGPERPVYALTELKKHAPGYYSEGREAGSYKAVEWSEDVAAGTTVFPWSHPTNWEYWDPTSKDDFVVGVWNGTGSGDIQLIPSDGFSVTGLGTTSGTIDLSGGASPAFPSGVAEGAWVMVSPHYRKDRSDYWSDAFWNNIKICGVYEAGFASGTTSSVNWSSTALNQGTTDNPVDADFHVSVNGATLVLNTDYTVTGGGTSSGSINFSPSLNDGDFYVITTDGHKTQGVAKVFNENVHSWYHNNHYDPGNPIAEWSVGDAYKWPTVKRMFIKSCEFYHDDAPTNQKAVSVTSTRPLASEPIDIQRQHPVPAGWRERFATYSFANVRWNVPLWNKTDLPSRWEIDTISPQYHDDAFDTYQGTPPTNPVTDDLLPDWWVTSASAPARIEV